MEGRSSRGEVVVRCSPSLRGRDRRYLRGLGHHLKPVVQVGDKGVHPGVIERVEAELENHELIKVKLRGADAAARTSAAEALRGATSCQVVQILGRTLLLYRPHPDEPTIVLPK